MFIYITWLGGLDTLQTSRNTDGLRSAGVVLDGQTDDSPILDYAMTHNGPIQKLNAENEQAAIILPISRNER